MKITIYISYILVTVFVLTFGIYQGLTNNGWVGLLMSGTIMLFSGTTLFAYRLKNKKA